MGKDAKQTIDKKERQRSSSQCKIIFSKNTFIQLSLLLNCHVEINASKYNTSVFYSSETLNQIPGSNFVNMFTVAIFIVC